MNVRAIAKYAVDLRSAFDKMKQAREAETWVTLTPDEVKAVLTAMHSLTEPTRMRRRVERRIRNVRAAQT